LAAEKAGPINVKIEWPEANLKVIVVTGCLLVGCVAIRELLVTVAPCWDVAAGWLFSGAPGALVVNQKAGSTHQQLWRRFRVVPDAVLICTFIMDA
jgi:hypothetical protein